MNGKKTIDCMEKCSAVLPNYLSTVVRVFVYTQWLNITLGSC